MEDIEIVSKNLQIVLEKIVKVMEETIPEAVNRAQKYYKIKARTMNKTRNKDISDIEIILEQEKEIEYYRNTIDKLEKIIKEN